MNYYIYKRGDKIVGHIQTNKNMPAPAVAVSEEEYKQLGFYKEPPAKAPSEGDRITALEEQLLATDETAVELYEMQLAQEEINMAQDDALTEIYELIGG